MKYKGKIEKLDHIVLSDPSYDKDVLCRYEKDNINGRNWLVNLEIAPDGVDNVFVMTLRKNNNFLIRNSQMLVPAETEINKYALGMDTACMAMGINAIAQEINSCRDDWQPDCAIKTGADGLFGEVHEGLLGDELQFLVIDGIVDSGFCSEEELLEDLTNNFEIKDLEKDIEQDTSKDNMDM